MLQRVSFNKSGLKVLPLVTAMCAMLAHPAAAEDEAGQGDGAQQYADLGSCPLVSGEAIEGCRIGFRTYGKLNDKKDNAVLVPTWYGGTSKGHAFLANDDVIDPGRYFVVIVDAIGNGVSSSPSNSETQPDEQFPVFTIRDMVNSQHRLLTEKLGINSLHAVVGLSMGGMQAFEWAVHYPGFARKTLPAIGSPRLPTFDIALWQTRNQLLALYRACQCIEATTISAGIDFIGQVPGKVEENVPREKALGELARQGQGGLDYLTNSITWDLERQAEAMITHNIAQDFADDMAAAAAATKTDFFIIVSTDDRIVTPGPAMAFGELTGVPVAVMDHDCGHGDPWCAPKEFGTYVSDFLKQ